jgi:hypothetical protein
MVFIGRVMVSRAFVALAISRLVSMEMIERLFPALRERSTISVVRVKAVVDVTVEAMRTVKPRTGPNEDPANKPVRSVVAVGRTVIGCIVEVPIGTHRRHSDVDAD